MLSICFFVSLSLTWCIEPKVEAVNKEFLGVYGVSRYYTPIAGQKSYYLNRSFEQDLAMNCSGDCLVTADGYRLQSVDAFKVVACPPDMKTGTKLYIEDVGNVVCHDRGGSIKNKRIDLWSGIGDEGLNNVYRMARIHAGQKNVYLIR